MRTDKITKLANDSKLEVNDIKACISLIEFILTSGAKHDIISETLSSELQQLGLPKEHSTSICKVYNDKNNELTALLKAQSLRCKLNFNNKGKKTVILKIILNLQ